MSKHFEDARAAIAEWLLGMSRASLVPLMSSNDVLLSCNVPDWSVRFWSAPNPRWPDRPAISGGGNMEIYPTGDNPHVILHEFGHLFGLDDTYVDPSNPIACQPGQPDSVMCEKSQSTQLMDDDVAGVERVYCNTFPKDCRP